MGRAVGQQHSPREVAVETNRRPVSNDDFDWDSFDSEKYFKKNYADLRDDDRKIMKRASDYFLASIPGHRQHDPYHKLHGIDVGAGTNLYPTFTMLPLCHSITLRERARTNREWLLHQRQSYAKSWDAFWQELENHAPLYKSVEDPRGAVLSRVEVVGGSIFNLPKETYEIGTMFFVAESITVLDREFRRATHCFVGSLKPKSPFAAAFMKGSRGYQVGSSRFPAVAITEADVKDCLSEVARDVTIETITSDSPLRHGYDGMILATGKAYKK
jgi:hypothetical protein